MAREYERRYQKRFSHFMNCAEQAWFEGTHTPATKAVQLPVRFLYVGGLHLGRDSVLVQIAESFSRLNIRRRLAELLVYTPAVDSPRASKLFGGLPFATAGSLAPDDILGEVKKSDVLIHVESFEPHFIDLTRYSISTKIPEYLASGKPILAVGPGSLASMRHLARSGGAIATDKADPQLLSLLAAKLLRPSYRDVVGQRGRQFARKHHEAQCVRHAFRSALSSFANERRNS